MASFIVVCEPAGPSYLETGLGAAVIQALAPEGWSGHKTEPGLWIATRGAVPLEVGALAGGVTIGDVFRRRGGRDPTGGAPLAPALRPALAKVRDTLWGRFVAVLRGADGEVGVYRDPSGALDAFAWWVGDALVVASDLPEALPAAAAPELVLDWEEIPRQLHHASDAPVRSALRGIVGLAPGGLLLARPGQISTSQLWRPADYVTRSRGTPGEQAKVLRAAVDEVLGAYADQQASALVECSGGFDSSVVASGLAALGQPIAGLLNYASHDPGGDERPYAEALACALKLPLEIRLKRPPDLSPGVLAEIATGLRPSFAAFDAAHEEDVLQAMETAGVRRLFTGQGGDSVFFQLTTPLVGRDRVLRLGLLGLISPEIGRLARWSRTSGYRLIAMGLGLRSAIAPASGGVPFMCGAPTSIHPWLEGLEQAGPAKRFQVQSLAHSLQRNGLTRLEGKVDLIHPLLAQPVLEAGLAIPADVLVTGGRGRGLARIAFRDRLPPVIYERRSKGELGAFYARGLAPALPAILTYLSKGVLAQKGLIDSDQLALALDETRLAEQAGFAPILRAVVIEAWVRRWSSFISGRPYPAKRDNLGDMDS